MRGGGRGREGVDEFESASVGSDEKNEKRMFRIITSKSACERDSDAPNAAIRTRRAKRSLGLPLGARRSGRARGEGTRARDPRAGRGRTRHGRPRWDFDLQRLALERAAAREEVAGGRGGGIIASQQSRRRARKGRAEGGALIAERRSGFGTARAARRPPRAHLGAFRPFRDAPVFAGRAPPPASRAPRLRNQLGGRCFSVPRALDDEPRDAARRARARGAPVAVARRRVR